MAGHGFTAEEVEEFGDVFEELDRAAEHLERAADILAARGYHARARKVRGLTQGAVGQKEMLLLDRQDRRRAA